MVPLRLNCSNGLVAEPVNLGFLCAAMGYQLNQCRPYEVCAPLSLSEIEDFQDILPPGGMVGDYGICSPPLPGGLMLPNATYVQPPMCARLKLALCLTSQPLAWPLRELPCLVVLWQWPFVASCKRLYFASM
jgi:hypothetical protein